MNTVMYCQLQFRTNIRGNFVLVLRTYYLLIRRVVMLLTVPMFVFIIHAEQNPTRLQSASYSWLSTASH